MPPIRLSRASIIATLGPASQSPDVVRGLIRAGVSIFRLNFSHGALADHAARLATVRAVADELGVPVGVLGDLPGPKIRCGVVPAPGIELATGADFLIDPSRREALPADASRRPGVAVLGCTYAAITSEVRPGQRVLLDDGSVRALAVAPEPGDPPGCLRCRVISGGVVTSSKGINLPETELSIPAVGPRDWECARWAIEHSLDFVAMSFVRTAGEVAQLQARLGELAVDVDNAPPMPVVAKIEKPQAVAGIEAIVRQADAIMVARGDLGVEMDIAQVPVAQKHVIATAQRWGRPCIVATEMLQSMVTRSTPTRAEASDVANAIFDGADAVMLSAESAVGAHPVLVVETMARIVVAAEARLASLPAWPTPPERLLGPEAPGHPTAALAHAAWHLAQGVRAKLVVCWSQTGGGARYLSQTGFRVPIVAYSSNPLATRRMALLGGVRPMSTEAPPATHEPGSSAPADALAWWNRRVDRDVQRLGWAEPGEAIVLMAGLPLGTRATTNLLAIHRVGDARSGFMARGLGSGQAAPPANHAQGAHP
ncbi:MAG: pyruvate kinase [Isosphaera sp.]|nr:pyruvate kinase [Isosphaera sp.]